MPPSTDSVPHSWPSDLAHVPTNPALLLTLLKLDAPVGPRARHLLAANLRAARPAQLVKLRVERLPIGADAGIAKATGMGGGRSYLTGGPPENPQPVGGQKARFGSRWRRLVYSSRSQRRWTKVNHSQMCGVSSARIAL
jgi:hypothetical protein